MVTVLKRTGYILWILITVIIAWIILYHADWMVIPPKLNAQPLGWDKQGGLPDPNRPYFDGCGNQYDYMGNLINKGSGCQPLQMPELSEFQGK